MLDVETSPGCSRAGGTARVARSLASVHMTGQPRASARNQDPSLVSLVVQSEWWPDPSVLWLLAQSAAWAALSA